MVWVSCSEGRAGGETQLWTYLVPISSKHHATWQISYTIMIIHFCANFATKSLDLRRGKTHRAPSMPSAAVKTLTDPLSKQGSLSIWPPSPRRDRKQSTETMDHRMQTKTMSGLSTPPPGFHRRYPDVPRMAIPFLDRGRDCRAGLGEVRARDPSMLRWLAVGQQQAPTPPTTSSSSHRTTPLQ